MARKDTIRRIANQVDALCNREQPFDEFLYAQAVAIALTDLGVAAGVDTADICFQDSDVEGLRMFAFTINQKPHDRFGNVGWEAIFEHMAQRNAAYRDREWDIVDGQDAGWILQDEASMRPNFMENARRVAGEARANVQAHQLAFAAPQQAPVAKPRPRF